MSYLRKTFELLGSFGLACIILVLMIVLTYFGTLDQQHMSLFAARQKYFESLIVFVSPLNIPIPGGLTLLTALSVNLIVGGILRMRWSASRAGILVIHFGIALMLFGGLIEFMTSKKGNLLLFEGESSAEFESYDEWEVAIREPLDGGRAREYLIPYEKLRKVGPGESMRWRAGGLPFDVVVSGYLANAQPVPSSSPDIGVDGFVLERLPREQESNRDVAGVTVAVEAGGGAQKGLLWGHQRAPWTVIADEKEWSFELRKRKWPLPFRVHLRDFQREVHPGTDMPARFSSDITCVQDNVSQDIHISMNEPLRRDGFILFQSGFLPGDRSSIFAVVENPADKLPLISLIIITIGLIANFVPKLFKHVKVTTARAAA